MSRESDERLASGDAWHLGIHHLASQPIAERDIERNGVALRALTLEPWQQSHEFRVTFDEVLATLTQWPGCYVEGDGSMVWRPFKGPNGPFLEANLFDGEVCLRHMELKGRAYREQFQQLFRLLGWPQDELVVQLVKEGLFVRASDFLELVPPLA